MSAISGSRDDGSNTNWRLVHYNNDGSFDRGTVIFDTSEIAAMRALIACAALLIAAALVSLILTVLKSWLSRNGKRSKTRLSMFVLLLVLIIAWVLLCHATPDSVLIRIDRSRATLIVDVVARLQGPNRQSVIFEYDYYDFLTRHVIVGLFSWVADIVFFFHILYEVTRSSGAALRKHSLFEWANIAVLSVLTVLGLAIWSYDTAYSMHDYYENYNFTMIWPLLFGLMLTYVLIAFLFATEMFFVIASRSFPKSQKVLLVSLAAAFWLGQVLDMVNVFVQAFSTSDSAYLVITSLQAATEFPWMAKVLLLALLGWNSYKVVRAGAITDDTAGKA